MNHLRRWRVAFALVAVLATVFAMARPASAHTGTTDPFGSGSSFSDIKFGNGGIDIGDAWLQRTQDSDGTETLNIHWHVADGVEEWQLCYSDTAYTSRQSPGSCQVSSGNLDEATQGTITVDLGTTYVGETLYVQLHFATSDGETAYVGWQPGSPFYGNFPLYPPPSADVAADCEESGALVTLTNNNEDDSVTFTIKKDGVTVGSPTVAADSTDTFTVDMDENETATIAVSAPNMQTVSEEITLDCLEPAAPSASIADADCVENGAVVTLTNDGEESVTFTITKDDVLVDTVEVGGNDSTDVTVPLDEDETATIVVSAPGMDDVSKEVNLDCSEALPSAVIADADCVEDGAVVTLTNDGTDSVTFTITKDDVLVDTVEVGANDSTDVTVPLTENETATIAVTAPGMDDVSKEVTLDCLEPAEPAADIAADCAEEGVVVSLSNTGDESVTFTITKDGTTVDTVEVAGGDEDEVLVPMAEDETATIAVTAPGMDDVSEEITLNCFEALPSAIIADADCEEDGAVVTLTNDGNEPVTFTITKDGTTVDTVEVAGGDTDTVTVPLAENETATIAVTAPGMDDVSKEVTLDCLEPAEPAAVIGDYDCIEDEVVVTLTNDGEESVTFTITKDGIVIDTVDVAGGVGETVTVTLAEDETAQLAVSAPGMTTVTKTVTKNCVLPSTIIRNVDDPVLTTTTPPAVIGNQVARGNAVLAATGLPVGTIRLLELAIGLLLAGTLMVRRSRRFN